MKNKAFLFMLITSIVIFSCGDDNDGGKRKIVEVPDVQIACTGIDPVNMADADVVLSGANCSETGLRNAIAQAGVDKIRCDCAGATININSEIVIDKDMIIDGGGAIFDGGGSTRIFHKLPLPGVDFTLQNATLRNGRSAASGGHILYLSGGLLLARSYDSDMAQGGDLVCINVTFEDSRTNSLSANDVAGGAVYVFGVAQAIFSQCTFDNNEASNGGAIGNLGSDLLIYNSVFTNNRALGNDAIAGFGGAIYIDGVESGGTNNVYSVCGTQFINNQAKRSGGASSSVTSDNKDVVVSFDRCSFSQNIAGSTGGNFVGGAIYHVEDEYAGAAGHGEPNFNLTNSTFIENTAELQGGGLWIIINGLGAIANCTFYKNAALNTDSSLGGAMAIANAGYGGDYIVANCTFAENTTELFSGVAYVSSPNFVAFHHNIFYNNRGATDYPGQGHQLNGDPGSYSGTGTVNLYYPTTIPNGSPDQLILIGSLNEDPLLLPPAANGSFPFTMALQAGSPAINKGDPATSTPVDQRGVARDATPDLGAYEYQ